MRAYSQQALRANQRLDAAIEKLDSVLGTQRGLIQALANTPDTISSNLAPQLSDLNNYIVNLINTISLLKQDIADKGLQLDIEEERRLAQEAALRAR